MCYVLLFIMSLRALGPKLAAARADKKEPRASCSHHLTGPQRPNNYLF